MARERLVIILALGLVLVMSWAGATGAGAQPFAPYTGVIKNCTRHSISIPSANSAATLIVPPGGFIEYVAWNPEFQLMGYLGGRPYYCQNIRVIPKNYQFMCKSYDFLAEIRAEEKPVKPSPGWKKIPKKKPRGEGVEGLG